MAPSSNTLRATSSNPLLSTKPSDTPLSVQLHPLVLLTISDYITRHTLRCQSGPITGAVIGEQNGREVTLEFAFETKISDKNDSDEVKLDEDFLTTRVEQYKEVHKAPPLDVVALFMLAPASGPQEWQVGVLKQVQTLLGNEGTMLLLFHPEGVASMEGGKLPISLYEPVREVLDGTEELRFREVAFEVETGEAEMIGVDFVAKGGGSAVAVAQAATTGGAESSGAKDGKKAKGKGKGKEGETVGEGSETNGSAQHMLSPEDEQLIASLTAKANAVKMLAQRVKLLQAYLAQLPESYLTDSTSEILPSDTTNHALLRNINALMVRQRLLAPSTPTPQSDTSSPINPSIATAASRAAADVHLTSLLASLTRATSEAQSMANKYKLVARERTNKDRNMSSFTSSGGYGNGSMGTAEAGGF
nr:hypothetical protein B0A51_00859 [Rachicladosporium sp. CCFEE 5018]